MTPDKEDDKMDDDIAAVASDHSDYGIESGASGVEDEDLESLPASYSMVTVASAVAQSSVSSPEDLAADRHSVISRTNSS